MNKSYSVILMSDNPHTGSLLVGDIGASRISTLSTANVKAVLTAGSRLNVKYDSTIKHLVIDIEDDEDENLLQYLSSAVNFIEEALSSTNVLIHCQMGRSRSVAICIAYLIKFKSRKYSEALEFVISKRKEANPNPGFRQQLMSYAKL